jgi:chromosome segregation protein
VSRSGDLWRWDGFVQAAEAPSAAARRLAERNRLGDLAREAVSARTTADRLKAEAKAAGASARAAASAEARALGAATVARKALDAARERLNAAERREAGAASRRAALEEALKRIAAAEGDARERAAAAQAALSALPPAPAGEAALGLARNRAAAARAAALDARAALQALVREAEARERRRAEIAGDLRSWRDRAARAETGASDLRARLDRVRTEAAGLREAPDALVGRRRALRSEIEGAETRRRVAADALAEGETALAAADRAARAALEALARAREARAGSQARAEAALEWVAALTRSIADTFDATPSGLAELAGLKPGTPAPPVAETEGRLATLKTERERLGAVNLRAEEEGAELGAKRDGIARERDDLQEAIKRLRGAIGGLNREGRERLLAAFTTVDGHFGRLFATLFGGGEAHLTLVDSDDPLEAGLEILARPPGKKPQTLTLLSGGEQALTATALIFAVFLTNPSPICVLDEVDAPLDDANVERFCDLLAGMARDTDTRFLVITHNPITMARMDRLVGVTMAERGVSQIVSVDLGGAERLLEAG